MRSSSDSATLTPADLGLEDVDAGLREATDVRHLGLELETFGVLDSEVLDRSRVEFLQIDRVDHPGRADVLRTH